MNMKAVQFTKANRTLQMMSVPIPQRKPNQLLIRVLAASLNPVDWKIRKNDIPMLPSPKTTGCDLVGIVEKADPDSKKFKKGDRVFCMLPILDYQGSLSEFVVVKESHVAKAPSNLTDEQVAGLGLVGQTVMQSFVKAGIAPDGSVAGKKILIHAGSGGVSSFAIQVAKICQLEIWTTCSPRNFQLVKNLGADHPIDYHTEKFEEIATEMDFIFDVMGGDYELRSIRCIKPDGHYITIMNSGWATKFGSDKKIPDGVSGATSTLGSVVGFCYSFYRSCAQYIVGPWYHFCVVQPRQQTLEAISNLAQENKLQPVIDQVFDFKDFKKAFERLESGHATGKVIVSSISNGQNQTEQSRL